MLLSRSGRRLAHRLFAIVPEEIRSEFRQETAATNLKRARLSAMLVIGAATIQLVALIIRYGANGLFTAPGLYHTVLHICGIAAMVFCLVLFGTIDNRHLTGRLFRVIEVWFTTTLLLWSVSLSFAAQLTTGSITFYVASIMAIGVIPLLEPKMSLIIFSVAQILFLAGLPLVQPLRGLRIEHSINTTMFACIGWAISRLLFSGRLQNFITEKSLESANQRLLALNRKLEGASLIDDLTQIPNRREFNRTLSLEWKRALRQSDRLSLVFVDIDYFKAYNDNYGHVPGDDCLRRVARALAFSLKRPGDFLARYGGDEFIVLLPGTGETGAAVVAENMKRAVRELMIVHEHCPISDHVSVSTGACTMRPEEDLSPELLVIAADRALYAEKLGNRRRIRGEQSTASD